MKKKKERESVSVFSIFIVVMSLIENRLENQVWFHDKSQAPPFDQPIHLFLVTWLGSSFYLGQILANSK